MWSALFQRAASMGFDAPLPSVLSFTFSVVFHDGGQFYLVGVLSCCSCLAGVKSPICLAYCSIQPEIPLGQLYEVLLLVPDVQDSYPGC